MNSNDKPAQLFDADNSCLTPEQVRERLAWHYLKIEALCSRYKISKRGEYIWQAEGPDTNCGPRWLLVEADGLGGADLIWGKGNVAGGDFWEDERRHFSTEAKACAAASLCLEDEGGIDRKVIAMIFDPVATPEDEIEVDA